MIEGASAGRTPDKRQAGGGQFFQIQHAIRVLRKTDGEGRRLPAVEAQHGQRGVLLVGEKKRLIDRHVRRGVAKSALDQPEGVHVLFSYNDAHFISLAALVSSSRPTGVVAGERLRMSGF